MTESSAGGEFLTVLTDALRTAGVRQGEAAALRFVKFIGDHPEARSIPECCLAFALALKETPVPELALSNFERLLEGTHDPERWSRFLLTQPRALEILLKLFVCSQHLTDMLIRQPELLRELTQQRRLADVKSRDVFMDELRQIIAIHGDAAAKLNALRRYQRREILRIGAGDTFSLLDLRATTGQLSRLAEALIDICLEVAAESLAIDPASITVLAFGKLGGGELNYSSDIDLVFLADSPSPAVIELAQRLVKALDDKTDEGFLYRVDLRLRPWGGAGPLVSSPAAFLTYLERQASDWERQSLLKARPVAGDVTLGRSCLQSAAPLIFRAMAPAELRAGVRASKQRIEAESRRRGDDWGDVKSGQGSLRDIEFIVQYLQLRHGSSQPAVRSTNTLDALIRLADQDCLDAQSYRQLTDGYIFLRTVEHALQLMHNQQRHVLPTDRHELNYLAQRLDYPDGETLVIHYERHMAAIRSIYRQLLDPREETASPASAKNAVSSEIVVPRYESFFTPEQQTHHRRWLNETSPQRPIRVRADRFGADWRVTIVGDDRPGDLSITCGLFFVHGFNILDGFVSTLAGERHDLSNLCINQFTVRPSDAALSQQTWDEFEAELNELLRRARVDETGKAQGILAKRVASAFADAALPHRKPLPLSIEFENLADADCTVLRLRAEDSLGFLYELTNALALCDVDIKSMWIRTQDSVAQDTLLIADAVRGGKIISDQRLQELQAAIVLIQQFTHLLPSAPNPEAALLHFRQLIAELFQRPNWVEELASLDRPDVLAALARVLGVSDFLWEDLLRLQYANLFPLLKDLSGLEAAKTCAELRADLQAELASATDRADLRRRLNDFKDREMFRVDMRHILGKIPEFRHFAEELTDLADVVIDAAGELCWSALVQRHGTPRLSTGAVCRYSVAALGKFGGREIGFASDIELMFLYEAEGVTDGQDALSNAEFHVRLAEALMACIQARQAGIFQIDLRLRPHGRQGSLASSRDAFEDYFGPQGPAWPYERQALVKLRPVAGDPELGQELMAVRDRLIYRNVPFDYRSMQAIRERQVRQLVQAGTFNAKLSPGGLVDLEYLVQALQLRFGHQAPALRTSTTSVAAQALSEAGHMTPADHEQLQAAYWFFRRLIDALRMVRGNAQDLTVPARDSEEFQFLARRLRYGSETRRLSDDIEFHNQAVLTLQRRYQTD